MSRRALIIAATLVVAVATLAAACGGGTSSKDKTSTAVATPGAATAVGKSTPGSGATSGAASTPASPPVASGDGGDPQIKAVAQKFADSTFKGTYTLSGDSGGAAFTDGQLTLTKDGTNKFRFDVSGKQDGQDVAIIFIETTDTSAFCLKNAGDFGALFGIPDGQGVCFKNDPSGANPIGSLADSLKDFQNANVTILETTKKTIAGQDGTCYKTKDNTTSEISTQCFTDDGVILSVVSEGANASTIEATAVSKTVDSGDFNLPYEVKDLPNIAGDATP